MSSVLDIILFDFTPRKKTPELESYNESLEIIPSRNLKIILKGNERILANILFLNNAQKKYLIDQAKAEPAPRLPPILISLIDLNKYLWPSTVYRVKSYGPSCTCCIKGVSA